MSTLQMTLIALLTLFLTAVGCILLTWTRWKNRAWIIFDGMALVVMIVFGLALRIPWLVFVPGLCVIIAAIVFKARLLRG